MKEPFTPHPNLSKQINDNIAKSEIDGGADLRQLHEGHALAVQTKNTLYIVKRLADGSLTIEGNQRICPLATPCRVHGSTWGGSMIKVDYIGRDMLMEFSIGDKVYTTSRIQDVMEVG